MSYWEGEFCPCHGRRECPTEPVVVHRGLLPENLKVAAGATMMAEAVKQGVRVTSMSPTRETAEAAKADFERRYPDLVGKVRFTYFETRYIERVERIPVHDEVEV